MNYKTTKSCGLVCHDSLVFWAGWALRYTFYVGWDSAIKVPLLRGAGVCLLNCLTHSRHHASVSAPSQEGNYWSGLCFVSCECETNETSETGF